MEKIIKPIKISKSNFSTEYGDLISSDNINPIRYKCWICKTL